MALNGASVQRNRAEKGRLLLSWPHAKPIGMHNSLDPSPLSHFPIHIACRVLDQNAQLKESLTHPHPQPKFFMHTLLDPLGPSHTA